jgi:hypothetical protein
MIKDTLKRHLVDCTAISIVSNPIFSGLETIAGMSVETSIQARIMGTALTYLGMGSIYAKGMDLSRKLFNVTEKSHLNLKKVHDMAYSGAYCFAFSPLFYYVAGSRDFGEIAISTTIGAAMSLVTGGFVGYSIDAYRDFSGIEESQRVPLFIKKQSKGMKKSIFAIGLAASLTASSIIYSTGEFCKQKYNQYAPVFSADKVNPSKSI